MTLHPMVASLYDAAHSDPGRVLLREGTDTTALSTFVQQVEQRAADWQSSGLRTGDVVLIVGERSSGLPIALLAAWRAGLVPALTERAPRQRLNVLAHQASARWQYDVATDALHEFDGDSVHVPGDVSHILFTSGTTGTPAAVAIGSEPLISAVDWYREAFHPTSLDRFVMLSGLGHDPVLRDIIIPISSGAELIIPPSNALRDPRSIIAALRDRVTVLHTTPSLVEFAFAALGQGEQLPQLRLVILGGERPRPETMRLLRATTSATVFNAYGATETPQIVAAREIALDASEEDLGLIGRGVGSAKLLLGNETTEEFRSVTQCADDEIIVRSRSLALGYLGDRSDRRRFVPDPEGDPAWRAYLTGDRGRVNGDSIAVVGRIDNELSVNGRRVHPAEIESVARSIRGVSDAKARLEVGELGSNIVLAIAVEHGTEVRTRDVKAALRQVLPAWSVPGRIEVNELGLTSNLKRSL